MKLAERLKKSSSFGEKSPIGRGVYFERTTYFDSALVKLTVPFQAPTTLANLMKKKKHTLMRGFVWENFDELQSSHLVSWQVMCWPNTSWRVRDWEYSEYCVEGTEDNGFITGRGPLSQKARRWINCVPISYWKPGLGPKCQCFFFSLVSCKAETRRILLLPSRCVICKRFSESMDHLFLYCNV